MLFLLVSFPLVSQITVPAFDDKYSNSIKKLENGLTDIDYADFRDSFIESEQFIKASAQGKQFDSLRTAMYKAMKDKNYPTVIAITQNMLSIDYTSMLAHKILRQTYKIVGDTVKAKQYKDIQFGLLRSIISSGDGKTCATGWHVIQIEEEYFILDVMEADLEEQSVDYTGGLCDRMDVKEEGKKKTYYFDVTKVFEGYKKLGME